MVEGVGTLKTAFNGIDKMLEEAQTQKHEDNYIFSNCVLIKLSSDTVIPHDI